MTVYVGDSLSNMNPVPDSVDARNAPWLRLGPLSWIKGRHYFRVWTMAFGVLSVLTVNAAYHWTALAPVAWLMFMGFIFHLRNCSTPRVAFYSGACAAYVVYAPPLMFFHSVFDVGWGRIPFSPLALILWGILAAWVGIAAAILCWVQARQGARTTAFLAPWIWMGIEFIRCEFNPLKFTWLTPGSVLIETSSLPWFMGLSAWGVYGLGAIWMGCAVLIERGIRRQFNDVAWIALGLGIAVGFASWRTYIAPSVAVTSEEATGTKVPAELPLKWVGIQLETPALADVFKALDTARQLYPDATLFALGEYTLDEEPPQILKNWCRRHAVYLILGGRVPVRDDVASSPKQSVGQRLFRSSDSGATAAIKFRNTAFVLSPEGEIVFTQAKSVPIQFFDDGLPALSQELWHSPWGPVGLAICYDASYRRVMDRYVELGANALIILAMDAESWGLTGHQLNARMTRVRAAEYGLPVFRVATSGISQWVDPTGKELATAGFPGQGERIVASPQFRANGGHRPIDAWLAPLSSIGVVGLLGWHGLVRRKRSGGLRRQDVSTR